MADGILKMFCEDHPHACGDKVRKALPHAEGDGSSPRVWGQASSDAERVIVRRIIPTRVGTSDASTAKQIDD